MKLIFRIWRQKGPEAKGGLKEYEVEDLTDDMSFLEALDHLNELLVLKGEEVITYEYDCREGICGSCNLMINGQAHGPEARTTTCQLHMRKFNDGDTIVILFTDDVLDVGRNRWV